MKSLLIKDGKNTSLRESSYSYSQADRKVGAGSEDGGGIQWTTKLSCTQAQGAQVKHQLWEKVTGHVG